MLKEFTINNKVVKLYGNISTKELPVIFLNTYSDNSEEVFNECLKLSCQNFLLVAISNLDWNNDMTPWYAPKLNSKDVDCLGKADNYINILVNNIVPKVEDYLESKDLKIKYCAIAGYSLAGLFALYITYKTNIFTRVISCSGSFWYPKFLEFIKEHSLNENIKKMYFSLGNRESKVNNIVLKTVLDRTKELEKFYHDKGIKTIYEENTGNHFKDVTLRVAKGIKWILDGN